MYIYYFDHKKVRDTSLKVSKIIDTENCPRGRSHIMKAFLDPDGEVDKEWVYVARKEGEIFYRKFWLEELDMDKANKIFKEYYEKMKEMYSKKLEAMDLI